MNTHTVKNALNAYGQVDLDASIMTASPVQLIVLLYDGAVGAIAKAKGMLQQQQYSEKSNQISRAIGIIDGLAAVLDMEKGGEISANLSALYDYMRRRLLTANMHNDEAALDEVAALLLGINESWKALASRSVAAPSASAGETAGRRSA